MAQDEIDLCVHEDAVRFALDGADAIVVGGDDRIRRFDEDIALDPFITQGRQTIGRDATLRHARVG